MKAFRNTGIEGGCYVTLDTIEYLRSRNRTFANTKKRIGEGGPSRERKLPDSKVILDPFPKGSNRTKLTAALLKYMESSGCHGNWSEKKKLLECGVIRELEKPTAYHPDGHSGYYFGGHYEITEKGRLYLKALTAPCVKEQMKE